jgi:2-dehydro-3-deoxyphosphogluconate aldolase/(4S)-4-hydroxy-2-oxoglutarate aldolase
MSDTKIRQRIRAAGAISVLTIENPEDGPDVARALIDGGIDVMEVTLRTDNALKAIENIADSVPDILLGVGTVLTPDQVQRAADAGAAFGVSPGLNPEVVKKAQSLDLPFAPGIATPSEIEQALTLNCQLLKFFPAEPSGGLKYLKSMAAPYSHLGLEYIPLGGVSTENIREYLSYPSIPAVGGSWLAPKDVIRAKDWKTITQNAREATEIVEEVRGS